MAFVFNSLRALSTMGPVSTEQPEPVFYSYNTNDADTVVETDAYFDTSFLKKGDIIMAALDVDGTPEIKFYIVSVGTGVAAANDVTVVAMIIV